MLPSLPVAPPGWPAGVRPPDAPDWERTATSWLFDISPPEFRGYDALRRHPLLLARLAVVSVEGQQTAADAGLSSARADLRGVVDGAVIEAGVETLQRERARLLGVRRAVGLVEDALRGRRYAARL